MSRTPPDVGGLRGMGGTGPGRPVVRIRRVQSERLPLHPWLGSASGAPPALPPPRHHDYHQLHHHAPKTAVIPPMAPRPLTSRLPTIRSPTPGSSQIWAQLPQLALGSPPPKAPAGVGMGVPAPPPGAPLTLRDQLAQDKLLQLLQEEPALIRPKSAASCPESPLYESLASNNSSDDDVTNSEEETESVYQKIRPLVSKLKSKSNPRIEIITMKEKENLLIKPVNKFDRTRSLSHLQKEEDIIWLPVRELPKVVNKERKPVMRCQSQRQPSHEKLHRLKTLDIRPDKKSKKSDTSEDEIYQEKCICKKSKTSAVRRSASTASRFTRISSQQSLNSQNYNNHTAFHSRSDVSSSKIMINNLNDHSPQTTLKSGSSKNSSSGHDFIQNNKKLSTKSLGVKYSPTFTPGERLYKIKNYASTSCLLSNNLNISNSSHSSSSNISKVHINAHPSYEMNIPPRTVEIPEVRKMSRKQEHVQTTANKATQVYIEEPKANKNEVKLDTPHERRRNYLKTQQSIKEKENQHISKGMKTLDLRKPSQMRKSTTNLNTVSHHNSEALPLIVNFESEYPTSDDDEEFSELMLDFDSDDTESVHGTAAELCSLIAPDNDSFVYIYQQVPSSQQSTSHKEELNTLRNRQRTYRDRSTYGSSGGSCDSEGSWGSGDNDHYRSSGGSSSNLSVGARGHLKIDYSCSWDNLDDFVRTSPKSIDTSSRGGYPSLPKGHPTSHKDGFSSLTKTHHPVHAGDGRRESILQAKVKLEVPRHHHQNHQHHRVSTSSGSSSIHRRHSMNQGSPHGAAVTPWERYQVTSSVAV
ncbi:unnamed protein product [Meganyctiphanes norvegica]|uniref:Uncharacterized protein n=1 Tax=Meganyctiphanes norvegica TaxID=48144 RepID=A0AAV2QCL2_MEGNR